MNSSRLGIAAALAVVGILLILFVSIIGGAVVLIGAIVLAVTARGSTRREDGPAAPPGA